MLKCTLCSNAKWKSFITLSILINIGVFIYLLTQSESDQVSEFTVSQKAMNEFGNLDSYQIRVNNEYRRLILPVFINASVSILMVRIWTDSIGKCFDDSDIWILFRTLLFSVESHDNISSWKVYKFNLQT